MNKSGAEKKERCGYAEIYMVLYNPIACPMMRLGFKDSST